MHPCSLTLVLPGLRLVGLRGQCDILSTQIQPYFQCGNVPVYYSGLIYDHEPAVPIQRGTLRPVPRMCPCLAALA